MILHARSFAKLNLSLDVLGRRADGYHLLSSVVHATDLADELTFDFSVPSLALSCDDASLQTPDNLVLRAAQLYAGAANLPANCRITLEKKVPSGAGLGGGSGNAAATLLAFNQVHGAFGFEELSHLGAQLGADVPLFFHEAPCLMEGVGELLMTLPALHGGVLIVQPPEPLATPLVYRAFDLGSFESRRDTPALVQALIADEDERLQEVARALGNDLQEAARTLAPVDELCEVLRDSGALGASMSGSGSACFGVFATEKDASRALNDVSAKALHRGARVRFAAAAALRSSFIELEAA